MRRFIARHFDKITGVLEGFDRLVFRGWLSKLCHENGLRTFLGEQGVLLKDFEPFAKTITGALLDAADHQAASFGDEVHYLTRPNISKEHVAREHLRQRHVRRGPICVLSAVEPCMTWQIRRARDKSHPQQPTGRHSKCLHHYHYVLDRTFGFCHVRVQTWFPFQVRVCINGREWLARRLDERRMRYERADNCFPWLASPDRAQQLMDDMLTLDWPAVLDELAFSANPMLQALSEQAGPFYWTVWQSEWATDLMFNDQPTLAASYPAFVRHAITNLDSRDVMRFLGKKLTPQYQGEVITDFKRRAEGVRVKHSAKRNSVKMYDKFGRVLRVEATINDPQEFKVRRKAQGDPQSPVLPRPLRKSVVDMRRLARVGKACNHRYLDSLATVGIDTPLGKLVEPLTRPAELGGRRVRGLRPWTELDVGLLQAVAKGEFLTNGFRNKDLLPLLFPRLPDDAGERRRLSARVTRMLRMLRAHKLIEKVAGTHRYLVTARGRTAVAAVIAARDVPLSSLETAA